MLGSEFKRGVVTTLERVFKASSYTFNELEFQWYGTGASIKFEVLGNTRMVDALFRFPNVDDNKEMPRKELPKFIGMVLHELGHAWFTDNRPWDVHRDNPTLCRIINGLEDPRIEKKVIGSGIAGNAFALFESLINEMMGGTYVDPDDFGNLAFQLAVEGRRMNGYKIALPSVLGKSRYKEPMQIALRRAHKAKSTSEVVEIAVELLARLNELKPPPAEAPEQPTPDDGEPESPGDEGGDAGDDDNPSKGDDAGDDDDDSAGDEDGGDEGEDEGEGEAEDGEDEGGENEGDEGDGEPLDKPSRGVDDPLREIEPDMTDVTAPYRTNVDESAEPRPTSVKSTVFKFHWE
jgi:hypothetical protein